MSKAASIASESVITPSLLSPKESIAGQLDSCQVRILLAPLGSDIPERRLRFYRKVISECHGELGTTTCLNGNINGRFSQLKFNFLSEFDPVAQDFIDFQLHFRFYAVIGLVSAEEIVKSGQEAILHRYNSILESISYPVCCRIFVIDVEEKVLSLSSPLVPIYMHDISRSLDAQFDEIASECVNQMTNLLDLLNTRPTIPSPCGIEDHSGTASKPSLKNRMKPSSRIQKLTADLLMLTGSFSEAVACYALAVEDAKNANDTIWQAAALEGFQIALCLQNERLLNAYDAQSYRALVDKLLPLTVQYEKSGIPMLSVILQVTCAKILRFIGLRQVSCNVLTDSWKSCWLLGHEDRFIAFQRVLNQIAKTKFLRKWSFYATQLALSLKNAQEIDAAIETFNSALSLDSGWKSLQTIMLREMLRLAESSTNRMLYFIFAWKYLSFCNRSLDSQEQMQLVDDLRKRSKRDIFALSSGFHEFSLLPIWVGLELKNANSGLYASNEQAKSEAASPYGPFIYAPNQELARKLVPCSNFIVGELARFIVTLKNPFVFPIQLRNVRLIADDEQAECEATSVLLPPLANNFMVSLNLFPKREGSIRILGVLMTFMNVQVSFPAELSVDVVPVQPLLKYVGTDFDRHVQIYEGESLDCALLVENDSSLPIRSITVSFAINEAGLSVEETIDSLLFDEPVSEAVTAGSEISNFDSNELFSIPITLSGHCQMKSFTASVTYSENQSFWRKLSIPFECLVSSAIKVSDCRIFAKENECLMSLFVENCVEEEVDIVVNRNASHKLAPRSCSRIFFSIPRLCLDSIDVECKLPLSEKQVATIRKLCKPDSNEFLDDSYEENLYNHTIFWVKKHIREQVKIEWILSGSGRRGICSLARLSLNLKEATTATYFTPIVKANEHCLTAKVGEPVHVEFLVKSGSDDCELNLSPFVDIGQDRLAVNYENCLLLSGPLKSFIRGGREAQSKKFTFIPIATANFVIKYQVTDLKTAKTCCSPADIRIKVTQ